MTPEIYKEIKSHYSFLTSMIMEAQYHNPRRWVSPYCDIEWQTIFTPIEELTWMALRSFGKCPMYPQYPVLNYFIDFGNPFFKIGIECDGHLYHLDKKKDNKRDKELFDAGWTIFRISGSDCYRNPSDDYYDLHYMPEEDQYFILKDYYLKTIEGLINAIAIFYCEYKVYNQAIKEIDLAFQCLQDRISIKEGNGLFKRYDRIINDYISNEQS